MIRRKEHKYIVSPYRHITVGGQKRSSVGFKTRKGAMRFIKRRQLKKAVLLVRKKRKNRR